MAETVDLGKMLEDRGAILRGHFVLTSGRHSDVYFEKFRVLEQPDVLSALCARIAETYRDAKIDVVAGPTTGGIIIAFEVARLLGVKSLYIESENGIKTIRRGATVAPGARVLVVDDVLTTGLSVRETIQCVQQAGGDVVAASVLIDRSAPNTDLGVEWTAAYKVEAQTWAASEVPEWLNAIAVTKPGTRPSA
ncbi:orotate phosphoribosyltransferase [Armatimonadetes bacterium Uphvl-Ar2]|nr:orotate phosphoribosyltransferase [Armatimonadetes bacterium Uphvl-Ar2]